jgi:hypothetical protein
MTLRRSRPNHPAGGLEYEMSLSLQCDSTRAVALETHAPARPRYLSRATKGVNVPPQTRLCSHQMELKDQAKLGPLHSLYNDHFKLHPPVQTVRKRRSRRIKGKGTECSNGQYEPVYRVREVPFQRTRKTLSKRQEKSCYAI